MSSSTTLKCPHCGAYLAYDPSQKSLTCPYCQTTITEEDFAKLTGRKTDETATPKPAPTGMQSYHCTNCGAEIVTGDTTAATHCYYCHSPIVLMDRLDDSFRPDGVIPFALDAESAKAEFRQYIKKKVFVDRAFFSSAQMDEFSGVYYPYWVGDVEGDASYEGEGTRTSVRHNPTETVTTTRFFRIQREGHITFRTMIRKALQATDRKLSDGIHPYEFEDSKPFTLAYLSGFMAEKRDVTEESAAEDMVQEAGGRVCQIMEEGLMFDTVRGSASFSNPETSLKYVLLPTWVLTYKNKQDGEPYYYMMNGQTGKVCGKLPINKLKLLLVSVASGLVTAGLMLLGGAYLW